MMTTVATRTTVNCDNRLQQTNAVKLENLGRPPAITCQVAPSHMTRVNVSMCLFFSIYLRVGYFRGRAPRTLDMNSRLQLVVNLY